MGIVIAIIMYIDLAKSFGKGGGFAVGLILLSFIFYSGSRFRQRDVPGAGGEQFVSLSGRLGPRDRVEDMPLLRPVGQVRMVEVAGRIVRHADPFHDFP